MFLSKKKREFRKIEKNYPAFFLLKETIEKYDGYYPSYKDRKNALFTNYRNLKFIVDRAYSDKNYLKMLDLKLDKYSYLMVKLISAKEQVEKGILSEEEFQPIIEKADECFGALISGIKITKAKDYFSNAEIVSEYIMTINEDLNKELSLLHEIDQVNSYK